MPVHSVMPALRCVVDAIWISESQAGLPGQREYNLPDGRMHLVIRLHGETVKLYRGPDATDSHAVADAVVAGPYHHAYLKDVARPARSIGVVFRPGAAQALFGCEPAELRNRHWPLEQLWAGDGDRLRDQLNAQTDPEKQLACLQSMLLARLRPFRGLHPQMAHALLGLRDGRNVGELVAASGYSHRRFIDLFREATGVSPKLYGRLLRFQQSLPLAAGKAAWSRIACDAGYSDQAHFIREFRSFSGLTPQAYRQAERRQGRHVRVDGGH